MNVWFNGFKNISDNFNEYSVFRGLVTENTGYHATVFSFNLITFMLPTLAPICFLCLLLKLVCLIAANLVVVVVI